MPTHIILSTASDSPTRALSVFPLRRSLISARHRAPGGPIPIPYPNIATQSSLSDGTTTVKAKGEMVAVKGSHYSRSNGDEAGTAGGVKSSVNMKATDWITYSFDVKMDGKNACRHTDKKFHNNQNTVDLGGQFDPNTPQPGLNPYQEALWKPCVEQHDKYDAIKKENEDHSNKYKTDNLEKPSQTKANIWSGRATLQEKKNYKKFLEERIAIADRMEKEERPISIWIATIFHGRAARPPRKSASTATATNSRTCANRSRMPS